MFKSFKVDNARRVEFEDKFIQIPKSRWAYLRNNIDTFHSTGGEGTPSGPIPIVNVSEWNKTACGRNLFDKSLPFISQGAAKTELETGIRLVSINATYASAYIIIALPSGISFKIYSYATLVSGEASTVRRFVHNVSNGVIGSTPLTATYSGFGANTMTFTVPENGLVALKFEASYNVANIVTVDYTDIQLEISTVTTPVYKPYIGTTFPYRLEGVNGILHYGGDLPDGTADTYNRETGQFVERKAQVVLNGTEFWSLSATNTNTIRFNFIKTGRKAGTAVRADKFLYFNSLGGATIPDAELITSGTAIVISVNKSRLVTEDVAGFKLWLADNNVTVQYALTAPQTYTIKQYGKTYGGVVWEYNEKPIQVESDMANVFTDKNITLKFKAVSYGG